MQKMGKREKRQPSPLFEAGRSELTSQSLAIDIITSTNVASKSETSKHSKRRRRRGDDKEISEQLFEIDELPSPTSPIHMSSAARSGIPLLIVSIGNPMKGSPTFHDAGHAALSILRNQTLPENWTLWSSSSFMNVSGTGVKRQFLNWPGRREGGRMVVLQDEIE